MNNLINSSLALSLFLLIPSSVSAATYYVSPSGNDNHVGTSVSQPLKSPATAISKLSPGDTLIFQPGTYSAVNITKSGTSNNPITITTSQPNSTVIDGNLSGHNYSLKATGSYLHVSGFKSLGASVFSSVLEGNHIIFDNNQVTGGPSHGLFIAGKHITATNNTIYEAVTGNKPVNENRGWGSGLKIAQGAENIVIKSNTVYNNYGEGIAATKSKNVVIENNTTYDNFSVNIYIDNSSNVEVKNNFSYCTETPKARLFYRSGKPAAGILIGEEKYDGWGAQLKNITITNNALYGCRGISFYGSEVNSGLDTALISNNTIWKIPDNARAIHIANEPNNRNIRIEKNVHPSTIVATAGSTISGNIDNPIFATTPTYSKTSLLLASNSPGYGVAGIQETTTTPPATKAGDLNGDGSVNVLDFSYLLSRFGSPYTVLDFAQVVANFGK